LKFVITNDDGIDAPGIAALVKACAGFGAEIVVVAPHLASSGIGHQVTTDATIAVDEDAPGRFRVHGTPADCTRLALTELAADAAWVLAGINRGANLGADAYISGTVAAVREAALLGRPAIALSQYIGPGREVDWELTARRVARVLARLFATSVGPAQFLNVNLPHPLAQNVDLEIADCELDPSPHGVRFERSPCGTGFVWAGDYHGRPRVAGRDVDVCFGGRIAVTRLSLDPAAAERPRT